MWTNLSVLLIASSLALLGYLVTRRLLDRTATVRALENYYRMAVEGDHPVPVGSQAHKVRLAFGPRVYGKENLYYWGVAAGAGLLMMTAARVAGLPWGLALPMGGGTGWLLVRSWIEGRWRKVVRQIESEMPTFLRTLGSMLVVTPNVLDALEETTASLDERGALRAWMQRLVEELRLHGGQGFERMREEAGRISGALLLAVVEIGRLWETGGQQFAQAFYQAAENQAHILRARNHAQAEIDGARSTLRVILLTLGGAIFFTIRVNPTPFHTWYGRMALLGVAVLAMLGWVLLQSMMDEVLS